MGTKVKVLYIAGWGRSGSTILGNVLGQIDGWCHVGEIRYLWDRGIVMNRKCGCHSSFHDCSFWSKVLFKAFGGIDQINPQEMVYLRDSFLRTRHLLLYRKDKLQNIVTRDMHRYLDALANLYESIAKVAGADIIVDSSKFPSHAYLLDTLPEIDLFIVQLVRDPRAVAYSWWMRKKRQLDIEKTEYLTPHNPLESALIWSEWNYIIKSVWGKCFSRYLLLKYEDLMRSPKESLERIVGMLGKENACLPFQGEREVILAESHTVSGNPDRFRTGVIRLHEDTKWKQRMPISQKALVTGLTMPWLRQYGYSIVC